MSIGSGGNIGIKLARQIAKSADVRADAIEKLSSGKVFSSRDPRPAERAISEQLDVKLRGMAAAKRNIGDAVSMLQTAESAMSEINNMIVRMRELNVSAASTTVTDQERRYLFIEYQALHDELNRIAQTTEFNGIPLLNGEDERSPEELIFRVDDPNDLGGQAEDDINLIRFEGFKEVVATAIGLGLGSAEDLLRGSSRQEGISLSDALDLMESATGDFATAYDEAVHELSSQRATFGAMQSRLHRSLDFLQVYEENLTAAQSNITSVDVARETVRMAEAGVLMQASTSLLAQAHFDTQLTMNLLATVTR